MGLKSSEPCQSGFLSPNYNQCRRGVFSLAEPYMLKSQVEMFMLCLFQANSNIVTIWIVQASGAKPKSEDEVWHCLL